MLQKADDTTHYPNYRRTYYKYDQKGEIPADKTNWKGSAFRPPKKAHQMGTLKWSVKVQQIGTPFFQIIRDKKIRSSKSCIGS